MPFCSAQMKCLISLQATPQTAPFDSTPITVSTLLPPYTLLLTTNSSPKYRPKSIVNPKEEMYHHKKE